MKGVRINRNPKIWSAGAAPHAVGAWLTPKNKTLPRYRYGLPRQIC